MRAKLSYLSCTHAHEWQRLVLCERKYERTIIMFVRFNSHIAHKNCWEYTSFQHASRAYVPRQKRATVCFELIKTSHQCALLIFRGAKAIKSRALSNKFREEDALSLFPYVRFVDIFPRIRAKNVKICCEMTSSNIWDCFLIYTLSWFHTEYIYIYLFISIQYECFNFLSFSFHIQMRVLRRNLIKEYLNEY